MHLALSDLKECQRHKNGRVHAEDACHHNLVMLVSRMLWREERRNSLIECLGFFVCDCGAILFDCFSFDLECSLFIITVFLSTVRVQIVEKLGVLVVVAEHERLLHLGSSDIPLFRLDAQQEVDLSLGQISVLGNEEF